MKNLTFVVGFFMMLLLGCSSEPVETDLLIPLTFSSLPAGLVKTDSFPRNLEIRIKGPDNKVKELSNKNLSYPVDLYADLAYDPAGIVSFIEPGFYSMPVIKDRIPLLPGVAITGITPSYITVQLNKESRIRLRVTVPYTGKPATGYVVHPASPHPAFVELTGADNEVVNLKKIETIPIDITGVTDDFKKKIPVNLDGSGKLTASPEIIVVAVHVSEEIITKRFTKIPLGIKNSVGNATIMPPDMEITIKGPANILNKTDIINQIKIYIDLQGLAPGIYVRRAVIKLPMGLILTDTSPEIFTVTIE